MTASTAERRAVPRYPVDTRIFASIDGNTVLLKNISEFGVAIHAAGLAAGSAHLLEINLNHSHVTLRVEIVDTSDPTLSHARFLALHDDAKALINQYISEFL